MPENTDIKPPPYRLPGVTMILEAVGGGLVLLAIVAGILGGVAAAQAWPILGGGMQGFGVLLGSGLALWLFGCVMLAVMGLLFWAGAKLIELQYQQAYHAQFATSLLKRLMPAPPPGDSS